MKILMLVNWKVEYSEKVPDNKQPPDYCLNDGTNYWFFRYFNKEVKVDVIDVSTFKWIEHIEKDKLKFYVIQSLKAIPKLNKYDFIISHGMQSAVVVSLWRRFIKTKAKHIVFDIGSFNSAAESGIILKLMQFVSKSIDGVIYHTSKQIEYYKKFFPWIVEKSKFIRFGTDFKFFNSNELLVEKSNQNSDEDYIVCVGYAKRDWDTLIEAYKKLNTNIKLKLIGNKDKKYENIKGIEQLPYIPIKELIKEIDNAKFCVLPLKYFNYSFGQMTLQQQMTLKKCVIAANVPSLTDYIEDGKTAVLYESGNVEELALKMKNIIDNPQVAEKIGQAAKDFIDNECNEVKMASEIETYLNKFIN